MSSRLFLFLAWAFAFGANAQTQTVSAVVDAGQPGPPMPEYIYGQFIEHIGGIINNGLWAEMLDDRKFYYPVTSQIQTRAPARGRFALRHWNFVGPETAVVMDTNLPCVGEHTPLVKLDGKEPHGIQQSGLAVRAGKKYAGRVVLAGDGGATECFFSKPQALQQRHPELYEQMKLYYQQEPARWLPSDPPN